MTALERDRCRKQPERRHHAWEWRHNDARTAKLAREPERMHRARAAESDHGQLGGRQPLFGNILARGRSHHLVDDLEDAARHALDRKSGRLCKPLVHSSVGGCEIERHVTAEETIGPKITEHKIGVGDGWLRTAKSIADRTGRSASTVWTDLHQAKRVHACDRTTPGP